MGPWFKNPNKRPSRGDDGGFEHSVSEMSPGTHVKAKVLDHYLKHSPPNTPDAYDHPPSASSTDLHLNVNIEESGSKEVPVHRYFATTHGCCPGEGTPSAAGWVLSEMLC